MKLEVKKLISIIGGSVLTFLPLTGCNTISRSMRRANRIDGNCLDKSKYLYNELKKEGLQK